MYETMRSMDFRGASGRVAFDENGDRRGVQIKIENIQNGVEHQVGIHDPLNGWLVLNASAIVWSSGNRGDIHAPTDGSEVQKTVGYPVVLDVVPRFSSPFGGETLTIVGRNFRAGTLIVTVGGQVCGSPRRLSPSTVSCVTPAGEGADVAVQVNIGGINSAPALVFAYNLVRVHVLHPPCLEPCMLLP